MEISLVIVQADQPRRKVAVTEFPTLLGRSSDVSIHLDDQFVSRRHCELDELNDVPVIRDLDSKNGTFVNGLQVDQTHLSQGDRITVGLTSIWVRYPEREASAEVAKSDVRCRSQRHTQLQAAGCPAGHPAGCPDI
jgi:pSer/pThr/pTyr-binding forkhead associated (FHA) protein